MAVNGDDSGGRKQYFDNLYAGNGDPWRYHECEYEIAKRADTATFLRARYASGCEIGCSIGVLTSELALRCDALLAIDVSERAVAIASEALRKFPHVEVAVMHVPYDRPARDVDLLMLSEVLYFFDVEELAQLASMAREMVVAGGDVLIVTYDGETQTRLTGRQATDAFVAHCAEDFEVVRVEQREHYHVRLLRRRS